MTHECEGCGAPLNLNKVACEYCRRRHTVTRLGADLDAYNRLALAQQAQLYCGNSYYNQQQQSQNTVNQYSVGWSDPRSIFGWWS